MLREMKIGEVRNDKEFDYSWVRVDEDGDVTLADGQNDELDGYDMAEYFDYDGGYRGRDCYGIGIGVWEEESPA